MSDKDRRKKDGHNTDKDRQAMRESVKQRHETAVTSHAGENDGHKDRLEGHDHDNLMDYKPGAGSDRNMQQGGKR
jgi:hypothetical protein